MINERITTRSTLESWYQWYHISYNNNFMCVQLLSVITVFGGNLQHDEHNNNYYCLRIVFLAYNNNNNKQPWDLSFSTIVCLIRGRRLSIPRMSGLSVKRVSGRIQILIYI